MIKKIKIGCLLGLSLLALSACSHETDIYLEEYEKNVFATEQPGTEEVTGTQADDAEAERICYVYICGVVVRPGVYAVPDGSRIYEVIEAAGGMMEEADDTLVNQAEPVTDGMMIRIYTREEAEARGGLTDGAPADAERSDGKVDINSAGIAELMTLPGIGSAKAEAIVTYREECGAFLSIEDLMNIPGIKEGIFRQIKEHIKVNK